MTYLVDLVGKILCGACDIVFHFASSTPASTRFMATSTLVGRSFGRVLDLSPILSESLCARGKSSTTGLLRLPCFPNTKSADEGIGIGA